MNSTLQSRLEAKNGSYASPRFNALNLLQLQSVTISSRRLAVIRPSSDSPSGLDHTAHALDVGQGHFRVQRQNEILFLDLVHGRVIRSAAAENRIPIVAVMNLRGFDVRFAKLCLEVLPAIDENRAQPGGVCPIDALQSDHLNLAAIGKAAFIRCEQGLAVGEN